MTSPVRNARGEAVDGDRGAVPLDQVDRPRRRVPELGAHGRESMNGSSGDRGRRPRGARPSSAERSRPQSPGRRGGTRPRRPDRCVTTPVERQVLADLVEVVLVEVEVLEGRPGPSAVRREHRGAVGGARRCAGDAVLGEVEGGARAEGGAQDQDPGAEPLQGGQRRALAALRVEVVDGDDLLRQGAERRERGLRVACCAGRPARCGPPRGPGPCARWASARGRSRGSRSRITGHQAAGTGGCGPLRGVAVGGRSGSGPPGSRTPRRRRGAPGPRPAGRLGSSPGP